MAIFDRKTAQILATILAFAAALWLLYGLRQLFFLLILAVFFAYTIEPLILAVYRVTPSSISRQSSIFATFVIVFTAFVVTSVVLGQMVVDQAAALIKQLPTLDQDPSAAVSIPLPAQLEPYRNELTHYGVESARSIASAVLSNLGSVGFMLLAPIFALFYLLEGPGYRNFLIKRAALINEEIWLTGLLNDLGSLLSNYIRALFLQSLTVFISHAIFYQLAGVPYAILLATIAAALEIIPVLGWITTALISILVAAFVGYPHLLWMLTFYLIFRVFQDYVVTPYVMRKGIELPAFFVLAGVIGGEMLGGISGMFLSIPILATVRIVYRHLARRSITFLLLVSSTLLQAHSISVSTSTATLEGQSLSLQLRIPKYEAEHVPQAGLADAIRFQDATLKSSSCSPVDAEILCNLSYLFSTAPGERINANVTLARVTVPNHVHIMRFSRKETTRQAVFDRTFENEVIDLREVGRAEIWWRAARMGFSQLLYQPVLILLLLIMILPVPYIAGAAASFFLVLPDQFYAVPGFFELATAISLTYLAIEQLMFKDAPAKWVIAAAIGALEGAALAVVARPSGNGAVAFGLGNLAASFTVSLLASRFSRNIPERHLRNLLWTFAVTGILWSIWVFVKRF